MSTSKAFLLLCIAGSMIGSMVTAMDPKTVHPLVPMDERPGLTEAFLMDEKTIIERKHRFERAQEKAQGAGVVFNPNNAAPLPRIKIDQQSFNPIPNPGNKDQKLIEFWTLATQDGAVKDTLALYRLACDTQVRSPLNNAKTIEELKGLTDNQGTSILEHAIAHNDARSVNFWSQRMPLEERKEIARYAAKEGKAKALLALLPAKENEAQEKMLKEWVFSIEDLTTAEFKTYQESLELIKRYRKDRAIAYYRVIQKARNKKMVEELVLSITQMIEPTVDVQCCNQSSYEKENGKRQKTGPKSLSSTKCSFIMHLGIQLAIEQRNKVRFKELVDAGWLGQEANCSGLDALSLAVNHGCSEIVQIIKENIPFVNREKREVLKLAAKAQKKMFLPKDKYGVDTKNNQMVNEYDQILKILDDWPHFVQRKNEQLEEALWEDHAGKVMAALNTGADPNGFNEIGCSFLEKALDKPNPLFLDIFFENGANPNLMTKSNDGKYFSLLCCALKKNKIDRTLLLLKAGAKDPEINRWSTYIHDVLIKDSSWLSAFLKGGLDPNSIITDFQGRQFSLLYRLIVAKKFEAALLLLEEGANPSLVEGDLLLPCLMHGDLAYWDRQLAQQRTIEIVDSAGDTLLIKALKEHKPLDVLCKIAQLIPQDCINKSNKLGKNALEIVLTDSHFQTFKGPDFDKLLHILTR